VIKSRIIRWESHAAPIAERRDAYRVFVGKPGGKKQLERPRNRWKDNIKTDL
jgi:hypothetical protein